MDYNEYLKNYIDSLKTGELLVDLTEHDFYVTEEGINIPIPTTKALKQKVTDFLDNDISAIELKRQLAGNKTKNLYNLNKSIEDKLNEIYSESRDLEGSGKDINNSYSFIQSVNINNVNQLGDLKVNFESLERLDINSNIEELVNEFNRVNTNAMSGIYSSSATNNNAYLLSLWNEIVGLMTDVTKKLDKIGSFSGNMKLKRNTTRQADAFDCIYSRRLYNFSNWTYINSQSDYIRAAQADQAKFEAWFRGSAYQDLTRVEMNEGTEWGTGLWYKNFPHKVDLATGSKAGRRYEKWDLFEGVPTANFSSFTLGWNINYLRSPTNNLLVDLYGRGQYANANNWTTRFVFSTASIDRSRFGYGSDLWRRPFSMNGATSTTTTDAMMGKVANMNDKYKMQRTPKQLYTSGITSRYAPAYATITREIPYRSSVGILNNDGIIIRMGLRKRVNETALDFASYQYTQNGWIKK